MAVPAVQLRQINVRGVVQGVGFRPFVYRLAHEHDLKGWVLNHSGGVEIEVEGPLPALEDFLRGLTALAPPLARIVGVEATEAPPAGYTSFEIRHSVAQEGLYQLISPDIATCPDCLYELLDPGDRRYRYPFTNCTNCGPRFTIIRDIPYDRPLTTMQPFAMCPSCQREYDDPLDRRFHAQPNACPVCGPHVWLEDPSRPGERLAERDGALRLAGQRLLEGKVLAIKGLGGFHLACDATNGEALDTLRARKGRPAKPLAVMMATMEDVHRHCLVSEPERALLTSQQCPIVLLRWRHESAVVRTVAPNNLYLGVMLPYTPLHHILLRDVDRPLVMTSGNLSEEPIAKDNQEALRRLGSLADFFLLHNRDIYARYDDSVVLSVQSSPHAARELDPMDRGSGTNAHAAGSGQVQFIRRSRGYAPFPVRLPFSASPILATGAELKNTFCLTRDDFAFLSQHIGDMENLETLEHYEAAIELYKHHFRVEPQVIAYDLHPDYLSTEYAKRTPQNTIQIGVQHHQAHVAACLADNGWDPAQGSVIGVAWDGTGYGSDGTMWGGEFFVGDYHQLRRVAHLEYLPMPGGDTAIRNPWRLAWAYVYVLTGRLLAPTEVREEEVRIVHQQVDRRLNSPLTSAVGRLFDAVAALIGVRQRVTYEAQAAIELEMLATQWANRRAEADSAIYPYDIEQEDGMAIVRLGRLVEAVLADLGMGVEPARIGWQFHRTLSEILADTCLAISRQTGVRTVALSGGCFQNRLLQALAVARLEEARFRVLIHRHVPCNDGGMSLGQATLAHFARGA